MMGFLYKSMWSFHGISAHPSAAHIRQTSHQPQTWTCLQTVRRHRTPCPCKALAVATAPCSTQASQLLRSSQTCSPKALDQHTICLLRLLQIINQTPYRRIDAVKDIVPTTSLRLQRPTLFYI